MTFQPSSWIVVTSENSPSVQQMEALREGGIHMRVLKCTEKENRDSAVCRDFAEQMPLFCTDDGRCFAGHRETAQLDALQREADKGGPNLVARGALPRPPHPRAFT
jgi:hypothetical protein